MVTVIQVCEAKLCMKTAVCWLSVEIGRRDGPLTSTTHSFLYCQHHVKVLKDHANQRARENPDIFIVVTQGEVTP